MVETSNGPEAKGPKAPDEFYIILLGVRVKKNILFAHKPLGEIESTACFF